MTRAIVPLIAAVAGLAVASPALADGPFRIVGPSALEVDATAVSPAASRFHLATEADASVTHPSAEVVGVAVGTAADPSLFGVFTPKLVHLGDTHWVLDLAYDPARLSVPATYSAYVLVEGTRKRAERFSQVLQLQVVRSAATVQAIGTFLAIREEPLFGPTVTSCQGVTLAETSRRYAARKLAWSKPGPTLLQDGDPCVAAIDPEPRELGAGERAMLSCKTSGTPPPGTAKGTMVLTWTPLMSPLDVSFEIRTRRTLSWIALMIGIGSALGWILRVGVKSAIERSRARLEVAKALEGLRATVAGCQDGDATAALRKIADDLAQQLEAADPAIARAKVTDARTQIEATKKELDNQLGTVRSSLDALRSSIHDASTLPESFSGAAHRASTALAPLEERLAAGDAKTPREALPRVEQDLAIALSDAAVRWRESALAVSDRLAGVIPALASQIVADRRGTLTAALDALRTAASPGSGSKLIDLIGAARAATYELITLAIAAGNKTLDEGQAAKSAAPGKMAVVEPVVAGLAHDLENPPGDPVALVETVVAACRALGDTAISVVRSILEKDPPPDIAALLRGRRFTDAIKAAQTAAAAVHGVPAGGPKTAPPQQVEVESLASWRGFEAALARARPGALPPVQPGSSFAVPELPTIVRRTWQALFIVETVQFVLVGALTVGLGLYLFSEGFVGGTKELFRVFAWGLTADLGAEGILAALGKTQK